MAGSILTAPSTTLSTNTVWQNELGYTEAARYGYDGVSLTEWESGNTTIPEIAAGSTIEIDGSMCEYAADTALTTTGIADGWCYIKHVVSGTVVTPTLVNTFGTWDTAKQGYYDGSGNRYSLFAMYRSGAVTKIYSYKAEIDKINEKKISIDSSIKRIYSSGNTEDDVFSQIEHLIPNTDDEYKVDGFWATTATNYIYYYKAQWIERTSSSVISVKGVRVAYYIPSGSVAHDYESIDLDSFTDGSTSAVTSGFNISYE